MTKSRFIDLCLCPRRYAINSDREFAKKVQALLEANDEWKDITNLLNEGNHTEKIAFQLFLEKYQNHFWYSKFERTEYESRYQDFLKAWKNDKYHWFYHPLFLYDDNKGEKFFLEIDFLYRDPVTKKVYVNELKAATSVKPIYFFDLLYQAYVLHQLDFHVDDFRMMLIDKQYVYGNDKPLIDIFKFIGYDKCYLKLLSTNPVISQLNFTQYLQNQDNFAKTLDLSGWFSVDIKRFFNDVSKFYLLAKPIRSAVRANNNDLPAAKLAKNHCDIKGMTCSYFNYCVYHLEKRKKNDGVFDLNCLKLNNKIKLASLMSNDNISNFSLTDINDAIDQKITFNFTALMQIYLKLTNNDIFIDYANLDFFLNEYKFPLYFFDFEASSVAIPFLPNTTPYSHIPFQYSCHVLTKECDYQQLIDQCLEDGGKNILHYEFLADDKKLYFERLIQKFIKDMFACGVGKYIAYNSSYERGCIVKMQRCFPKYAEQLQIILNNLIDLRDIYNLNWSSANHYLNSGTNLPYDAQFARIIERCYNGAIKNSGAIYHRNFQGSFSIKSVLPTFFPSFVYKNLDVQKGDQAMGLFVDFVRDKISYEQWKSKYAPALLKYCYRDSLAMVLLFAKAKQLLCCK